MIIAMKTKWEYAVEVYQIPSGRVREVGSEMESLGQNGWELVSVISYHTDHCVGFFKRPV